MTSRCVSGLIPSKKNETLNFMKGLIAISIVFTHIFCQVDKENSGEQSIVAGMLYMCLMSFFIMSGYFFRSNRSYLDNVKKRFKNIVIPLSVCIIVLPLILYAYLYVVGQPQQFSDYTNNVFNFLLGESRFGLRIGDVAHENIPVMISLGYYFLMTMFGSFLLFYAIANKAMKNVKTFIATIVALLVVQAIFVETIEWYLPYFLQIVPIAASFMLVGSWVAKNGYVDKMENYGWKNRKVVCCFVITLALDAVIVAFFRPDDELIEMCFGKYGGLSVFPYFITGLLSCTCFFCASLLLTKIRPLSSLIILAGEHTLAIILFHEFFIKLLISPFYILPSFPLTKEFPPLPIEVAIATGALTLIIITILAVLYNRAFEKLKV